MDWDKGLKFIKLKKGKFLFTGILTLLTGFLMIFIFKQQMYQPPLTSYLMLEAAEETTIEAALEISEESSGALDFDVELQHIYVDIKGAVNRPGVYQLEEGSRLFDLIDLAGGLTFEAYEDGINLAQRLEDQMMVRIYCKAEMEAHLNAQESEGVVEEFETQLTPPSIIIQQTTDLEESSNALVNINTASAAELESLPNIGPKKAQDIILYRETNGSYQEIEELLNVSGIGSKTFASLQDLVTVHP